MPRPRRAALAALALALLALAGCGGGEPAAARSGLYPNETPALRAMIEDASRRYGVPSDLVQRVVVRESGHVPSARNGPYYGLMQIHPQTARTMGFRGPPAALLDPEINLTYGVRYLRGAWLVADGDRDEAVGWVRAGLLLRGQAQGAAGGDRAAVGVLRRGEGAAW